MYVYIEFQEGNPKEKLYLVEVGFANSSMTSASIKNSRQQCKVFNYLYMVWFDCNELDYVKQLD